ncbi:MAG: peptidase [Bacteroidetes bacterium GWF2_33_38]|nr:MAG: peptidase [Bacteroidetes bacterium GWF2_33_38]
MKKNLKIFFLFLFFIVIVSTLFLFSQNTTQLKEDNLRFEEKVKDALTFCETNDYNTDFCILIDMKIHSGKYRMFIYDFKSKKVERQSLCAHGCGKNDLTSTGAQPFFSNEEGSLLTSLGKYKIGARSYSQWGINVHYKLHGLEASNNNAYKRNVVLHSHSPVPTVEIYPLHMPMGWSYGCPVIDNSTMSYLDAKLKNTKKSVLLWIYS